MVASFDEIECTFNYIKSTLIQRHDVDSMLCAQKEVV